MFPHYPWFLLLSSVSSLSSSLMSIINRLLAYFIIYAPLFLSLYRVRYSINLGNELAILSDCNHQPVRAINTYTH